MIRSCAPIIACGLVMGWFLPAPGLGQSMRPLPGQGLQWAVTDSLQGLTISGIVFDVSTGEPVQAAQAYVGGGSVGALTDSDGHFVFRVQDAGAFEFQVDRLGLTSIRDSILVSEDRGTVVYAGLRPRWTGFCDLICVGSCPRGAQFQLEIREVLTGRAPAVPVTLQVYYASGADTILLEPLAHRHARATVALPDSVNLPGPYDISIVTEEYAPWRAGDIWLEWGCPDRQSPLIYVWLMPPGD